jgi:protein O-GlcNAc transferase
LPIEQHLARLALADLFLDTLPCNAHTTASDALWMGLPVLTCKGTTFAGRVAASLLNAADLPELVAETMESYEQLAIQLGRERGLLESMQNKLKQNRFSCALFDTDRFRRDIESAFSAMWQTSQRGEFARGFSVDSIA